VPDLAGKSQRVIGTFVFMIGAGLVLESHAGWLGTGLMIAGAALVGWGLLAAPPRRVETDAARAEPKASGTPLPDSHATESRV
jgi:hypothetical protein